MTQFLVIFIPLLLGLAHDDTPKNATLVVHHHGKTYRVVPCDTDSDCMAKNPHIPFGLD